MASVASLVRPILLGVLGLGLAALVISVTPGDEVLFPALQGGPEAKADDNEALFREATQQYVQTQQLPKSTYAAARRIAAEQPLASQPFAVVAVEALEQGKAARAIALLEAARWRNPRDRFARVVLLEQYARASAFPKAAEELSALYRLVPNVGAVLIDTMAKMALDPAGFGPLAKAVHGEPVVGPLLTHMVRTGAPVDRILLLSRGLPASNEPEQTQWRDLLLQRLVTEGRYGQARTLWASFSKIPQAERAKPYYNLELARSSALTPFNWTLAAENIGEVDLLPRGIASITYFGRETGPLLSQLLTLSPGKYRFRFAIEGSRDDQGSNLGWQVRCAQPDRRPDAGPSLAEIALPGDAQTKRGFAAEFTVPSGCTAQWLSLVGTSSEFPSTKTLEISGLSLVKKDG